MEKDVMKAVMVLLKVQAWTLMPLRRLFHYHRPFAEHLRLLHQT
jgi:hypothetical protein